LQQARKPPFDIELDRLAGFSPLHGDSFDEIPDRHGGFGIAAALRDRRGETVDGSQISRLGGRVQGDDGDRLGQFFDLHSNPAPVDFQAIDGARKCLDRRCAGKHGRGGALYLTDNLGELAFKPGADVDAIGSESLPFIVIGLEKKLDR
jgi:hypothetical protein